MYDELLRLRRRSAGRPLGWKLGFGAPAAMAHLGIDAPLVGFLSDATLLEPGAEVSLAGWTLPVFEPELAVRVGEDGGIDALAPAIELADLVFPQDDARRILGANVFHRAVVLGPFRERRDAVGIRVRVLRDGEQLAATDEPEALTGPLADAVEVVRAAVGDELRPGDVIIAGSVVPPVRNPSGTFRVEAEPLGAVELRLR